MTESSYAEKQPTVFWQDTILRHKDSLDDAGIAVLRRQEKNGRKITYEGLDNIPDNGGFILAANHFVRMTDKTRALGRHKMEDLLASLGALTDGVRRRHGENTSVIWTPSRVPRPEAVFPKGSSVEDTLKWLAKGSPSMGVSNLSRSLFLSLYKNARDVVPIPYDAKEREQFFSTMRSRLNEGDVLALFPEGEVSHALRRGKLGAAHIAIQSRAPVVPVAQYDLNGELMVRIGKPMQPPIELTGARPFLNDIMGAISKMLPPELRGFYGEPRKVAS